MADYYITSDQSTVSGAQTTLTEVVSISAKPTITRVKPDEIFAGYPVSVVVQGYNLDRTQHVFLSASSTVYTTELSATTAFNPFHNSAPPYLSGQDTVAPGFALSALYPAFSAFEVKKEEYSIQSPNALTFTLCATQGTGNINIIIVNPAGYSDYKPFMDMSTLSGMTRSITVKSLPTIQGWLNVLRTEHQVLTASELPLILEDGRVYTGTAPLYVVLENFDESVDVQADS